MGQCCSKCLPKRMYNNVKNTGCSNCCVDDMQLAAFESDCKEYEVYCHTTPSDICDSWWRDTVGSKETLNVCVLGSIGTGRTSLLQRFTGRTASKPVDGYSPMSSDVIPGEYEFPLDVGNQHCDLKISTLDDVNLIYPASQRRGEIIRKGQIFICCFAVDSRASYESALTARDRIIREREDDTDYSVVLVATKCDGERTVDRIGAMEFAKEHDIAYIETSVKEDKNVRLLFERSVFEHWAQTVRRGQDFDGSPHVHKVSVHKVPSVSTSMTPASNASTESVGMTLGRADQLETPGMRGSTPQSTPRGTPGTTPISTPTPDGGQQSDTGNEGI